MAIKNVEITNRVLKREGSSGSVSNVPSSLSYDLRELANKVDNSFFGKLFSAIDSDGNVIPVNGSATPVRIRANFDFFSVGESSAFGIDPSGGGGGGGGVTVYDGLDSTNPNIALSANQGRVLKGLIDNMDLSAYALKSELATVATSGSYNDLTNKPTIPAAQIQSDWNQTTTTAKDYIKNKPTIPAAQVQSNWNATSGMGVILNKPTKVSAFTNDANYVTSSSLTTTLASYATQTWVTNKGYATTSAMNTELAKYLPLTGGTMSNTNLVTNLNADLLDGIHASGLFTQLTNDGDDISVTIGGTNKTLTVGYASKSKKAGDSWTSVVTIGEWSKVLEISGFTAVLLSVNLNASSQSANATFLINNAWSCARIVQIGTGGYTRNSNFDIRITSSGGTTIDVEIKTSYSYQSATTQDVVCHAVNIHNSGTLTPYTSYTAGSGTLVDSFTSYSRYSFIGNSLRLNGGSTSTTSPDLYIAGTSWFDGAIKVGNAYIWWDETNSCLRITGANSSGTPVASVAANVNVSGEVSALGANTSGGGGGGDGASLAAVWTSLGSSTGTYGSSQINASHLTNALASYATQSWVNQQGFLKSYTETDPVFVASPAHGITASNISAWNNKQDAISDLATIRSNASAGAAKVSNVQADWTATSGLAVILHKPTLATVATSGKYSDLTGTPTKVSDFTNDANYVTSSSLATTLASYATTSAMNTALSGYLPLTGGTLSGNLSVERTGTTDSSKVTVTNGNGSVSLLTSTPNRGIYDDDNSKWLIGTNGANTFLLDGYVGINTTAPSYQLHVNGNTYASRYYAGGSNYLAGDSTWLYFIVDSATPLVAGSTYVRRGISDSDVTLGTSSYRWANLYSVLGNFSGQITSSVATGTSPLSVASTTLNTNLNADLLDGIHASGLFTELANSGNNISLTIGGTNKTLTVGYASKSKKAGDSWTSVVTIGEWSKVLKISGFTAVLLSVCLSASSQSANATFLINNAWSCARIVQIGTGGYTVHSNFDIRITRSGNTTIDVEIKTSYSYQSATTQDVVCHAVNIHNSGMFAPYTSYTAGSGTLVDSFTSYSRYSFIGNSLRLNGGSTSTTSPDLYIAGTSWFGGAIKVGNAYIWWDETNSCLRITGANSSGTPVSSVAVNVNVSGEVSTLKTS